MADRVVVEFTCHESLKKQHLMYALRKALNKDVDRMGRVEHDSDADVFRVTMFVEVSDCAFPQDSNGEEKIDPLPLYERGEGPPEYVEI